MAFIPARERQKIVWLRPIGPSSVTFAMDDPRNDFAVAFAGVILERRVTMGIGSQAELGRLVGVSEATAGRWERHDGHLPGAWELLRLCEVLDVTPEELLHPEPLTPRERELTRRAVRRVRRPQAPRDASGPAA